MRTPCQVPLAGLSEKERAQARNEARVMQELVGLRAGARAGGEAKRRQESLAGRQNGPRGRGCS
jgi:hypothetical protein